MDRLALFPTPVFVVEVDSVLALNLELAERLATESQVVTGVTRSNIGGWHSPPDLALRPEPCFRNVMQLIIDHVDQVATGLAQERGAPAPPRYRYTAHAWAMVMRDGDYTIPHEHGEAQWSAAYYVDAGDADLTRHPDSGTLSLLDPRRGSRPAPGQDEPITFNILPRTALLVIFPGWLLHYVRPYRGRRPRIAVSCNVNAALAT